MTITKKQLLLIAAVPLVLVVTLGVLAMLPPRPGVTKANFDRIEEGMTHEEVVRILGEASIGMGTFERGGVYSSTEIWAGADGSGARIEFVKVIRDDEPEQVSTMTWKDSSDTAFQKIRRWLHLP